MTFQVSIDIRDQVAVITLVGDLNIGSSAPLRHVLSQVVQAPSVSCVVVDCTRVTLLDLTQSSLFTVAQCQLSSANCSFVHANVRSGSGRAIGLAGFDKLLNVWRNDRPPEQSWTTLGRKTCHSHRTEPLDDAPRPTPWTSSVPAPSSFS